MILTLFSELPVGARFRLFKVANVAVYTKTTLDAGTDNYGEPIYNSSSSKFGFTRLLNEDYVLSLTDEEVVQASKLEDIFRLGREIEKGMFITPGNEYYVKVKILEREQSTNNDVFS